MLVFILPFSRISNVVDDYTYEVKDYPVEYEYMKAGDILLLFSDKQKKLYGIFRVKGVEKDKENAILRIVINSLLAYKGGLHISIPYEKKILSRGERIPFLLPRFTGIRLLELFRTLNNRLFQSIAITIQRTNVRLEAQITMFYPIVRNILIYADANLHTLLDEINSIYVHIRNYVLTRNSNIYKNGIKFAWKLYNRIFQRDTFLPKALYENNTYIYFRSLNEDLELFPVEFLYNGSDIFNRIYNVSRVLEGNDNVSIFSEIRSSYKIRFLLIVDPAKSGYDFNEEKKHILSVLKDSKDIELIVIEEEIGVRDFIAMIGYADIIHFIGLGEINPKKQLGLYINQKGVFWISEIEHIFEKRPNLMFLNIFYPSEYTFFSGLKLKSFFVDNLILPPFQIPPSSFAKEIALFYKRFLAGKSIGYALLSSFENFEVGTPFFFYGDKRDKLHNRKIYLQ